MNFELSNISAEQRSLMSWVSRLNNNSDVSVL